MADLVSTQNTDWTQVFRDIAAYGATRVLNPNANNQLYAPMQSNLITPDGVAYTVGQSGAVSSVASSPTGVVLPSGLLLIAGAIAVFWLIEKK